jgi:two-component system phosphate regulon response regulator PhoB
MKTIVIADDEFHLRFLVLKTLERPDYRLLEAENGAQALELARQEQPDLLILDWMMPELSGVQVLNALREDPATTHIPVIMLTAKSQKTNQHQAILLGIRAFLVKPFSPRELIERVEKVFANPGTS